MEKGSPIASPSSPPTRVTRKPRTIVLNAWSQGSKINHMRIGSVITDPAKAVGAAADRCNRFTLRSHGSQSRPRLTPIARRNGSSRATSLEPEQLSQPTHTARRAASTTRWWVTGVIRIAKTQAPLHTFTQVRILSSLLETRANAARMHFKWAALGCFVLTIKRGADIILLRGTVVSLAPPPPPKGKRGVSSGACCHPRGRAPLSWSYQDRR
jgi:hypothetical protein